MVGTIWALSWNTVKQNRWFFTFVWTVVMKLSHRHIGPNTDALISNTPEPARRTFIRVRLWDLYHDTMNKHQIT